MISVKERGLARSRNLALDNALGDICLFCDDDEKLVCGYDTIIQKAFNDIKKADIIAFDYSEDKDYIHRYNKLLYYGSGEGRAPLFKTYASVQICFRRERIINSGVKFDINFGAGSGKIGAGEETV